MRAPFPFSAIVAQDEMKLALLTAAVDPGIGGVLVFGDRGTGKSTAVRALAALLPPMQAVVGCPYHCAPSATAGLCSVCRPAPADRAAAAKGAAKRNAVLAAKTTAKTSAALSAKAAKAAQAAQAAGQGAAAAARRTATVDRAAAAADPGPATVAAAAGAAAAALPVQWLPVPVIDLPLGATEDRVVGALDLERALAHGVKAFEPGLLARANRGFLYIDEANLLEDHLVDVLLDVAASGENVVERDGLSIRHPARFVLVGSGNPEEGELRPQLLDRFGLSVEVKTPTDLPTRIEVVRRRDAYERDPAAFVASWAPQDAALREKIVAAVERLPRVEVPDVALERAAQLCMALGTDGLRGELTVMRAARALAALEGDLLVDDSHLRRVAPSALRHRLRRNPLDDAGSGSRVERALAEVFATDQRVEATVSAVA